MVFVPTGLDSVTLTVTVTLTLTPTSLLSVSSL